MTPRFISSLESISADTWNALVSNNYPFAKHEYLHALEQSKSACQDSGWAATHLIIEQDDELIAAVPLYIKTHSYGEYVFDWQWANAFERYGRAYYPKLLTAIPFTPAAGPRVLHRDTLLLADILPLVRTSIEQIAKNNAASSWHLLFSDAGLQQVLNKQQGLSHREDVQFHWLNTSEPYTNFDDFLSRFRSSKRKQIKRERRRVLEQGIQIERRTGAQIRPQDWDAFYQCYQATYLKRSGHGGYLNSAFFDQIARELGSQCMLVTAYKGELPIAASLFFFDDLCLYGRYWGALADIDCLHFEACYYQGIEFAIEQNLERFDPGTQGEHKLVRGFVPVKTHSYHWVADAEFARAIDAFLVREKQQTDRYRDAAAQHLPFHRSADELN